MEKDNDTNPVQEVDAGMKKIIVLIIVIIIIGAAYYMTRPPKYEITSTMEYFYLDLEYESTYEVRGVYINGTVQSLSDKWLGVDIEIKLFDQNGTVLAKSEDNVQHRIDTTIVLEPGESEDFSLYFAPYLAQKATSYTISSGTFKVREPWEPGDPWPP